MGEHRHFDEIAESLVVQPVEASGGARLSRPLLAEVLSRVAVCTPPVATRADIAGGQMLQVALPLSEGSVSRAVSSLVHHELLDEELIEPQRPRRTGRPVASVRLSRARWFTIGVHIAQDGGRPVAVKAVAVPIDDHRYLDAEDQDITIDPAHAGPGWPAAAVAAAVVSAVTAIAERMVNTERRRGNWLPLLGVGVTIGLPVRDGAVLAPSGTALQGHKLRERLVQALDIPVVLENDATVLAVRETYGQNVRRDFALVLVAEDGVRAAVAIDGRVRRGAEGMAGAIGDIAVQRHDGDAAVGTVSSRAAVGRLRAAFALDGAGQPGLTGEAARELLDDAGEALGQGLVALMRVVDPDQIRIILPSALHTGPGRRYRDRAEAELAAAYAARGQPDDVNPDVVAADDLPQQCARAAAIRVVVEFIDHLSGLDGCPPADRSVPSWLASGRAAVVGGALGAAIAPIVPVVPLIPVVAAAAYAGARYARRRWSLGQLARLPRPF